MTENYDNMYDAYYYQTSCGRPYQRDDEWLRFFDRIAERIIEEINPVTVLDAGCAMGFLVEALRNRGVQAYGVDVSEYAIQNVHPDVRPYCWVGSAAEPFPQKYDLIVTIEVLEHMPKNVAEETVKNFCCHTDDILFSSGTEDRKEVTHINMHPPEIWAGLFGRQGFFRDVDFDATFITPWSVRFRRNSEPAHRIVMDYERRIDRLIQENVALRQMNQEQKNTLAYKDGELHDMHVKLGSIYASKVYQVARRLQFLSPPGSRRERFLLSTWQILRRLKNKGKQ